MSKTTDPNLAYYQGFAKRPPGVTPWEIRPWHYTERRNGEPTEVSGHGHTIPIGELFCRMPNDEGDDICSNRHRYSAQNNLRDHVKKHHAELAAKMSHKSGPPNVDLKKYSERHWKQLVPLIKAAAVEFHKDVESARNFYKSPAPSPLAPPEPKDSPHESVEDVSASNSFTQQGDSAPIAPDNQLAKPVVPMGLGLNNQRAKPFVDKMREKVLAKKHQPASTLPEEQLVGLRRTTRNRSRPDDIVISQGPPPVRAPNKTANNGSQKPGINKFAPLRGPNKKRRLNNQETSRQEVDEQRTDGQGACDKEAGIPDPVPLRTATFDNHILSPIFQSSSVVRPSAKTRTTSMDVNKKMKLESEGEPMPEMSSKAHHSKPITTVKPKHEDQSMPENRPSRPLRTGFFDNVRWE